MRAMIRDRNDIKCHFCGRVESFQNLSAPLRVKQQLENYGQRSQQREEQQKHPRRQHQRNRWGGRGPVWCLYHKTIFHSDAACRARRRKQADGNAHIAATGPSRIKGNSQRLRPSRRGPPDGTPLNLLHSDGGTSHGGNCRGEKPQ